MSAPELSFVIPTYRLRDVSDTITQYDQHFWRNGHVVRIIVFDDSTSATQEKYFPLLEQPRTHNELFYVGPREKEAFLVYLNRRLRDARLEGVLRNLFRPSYGGNRNCTLMYTLGGLMVSSDDDMRPYALMEDSPESLEADEVSRGRLHKSGQGRQVHKSSVTHLDELTVEFDYDGQVSALDAQEVLDKIVSLHRRALEGIARAASPERADALRLFAGNLQKAFYGFEPDFFQQNLTRIVDDVISVIKGSIELWPTLIEISYLEKGRRGLPQLRVRNQRA